MDDNDFDVLVRRAGAAPVAGETTLAALVAATRSHAHGRRRPGRRALVLGGLAAGSLLLAAGASTSVLMHEAPFQSAEVGVYRTRASIPVDYTSTSGHANQCLAFLEFHDLGPAGARQAEAFVRHHDWSGIGQRAYDSAARRESDPDAVLTTMDAELGAALRSAAVAALPVAPSAVGTSGPAWNGSSMSCAGGQR